MVRIKHRYLLLDILFPEPSTNTKSTSRIPTIPTDILQFHEPTPKHISPGVIANLIRTQVSELFGDYGVGVIASGLKIVYFSPATSTAIVRCPRNHYRLVWAALTFVEELPGPRLGREVEGGKKCVIRVVRVSGTIKKAEEQLIRRARMEVLRMKSLEGGAGDGGLEKMFGSTENDNAGGNLAGGEGDMEDIDVVDDGEMEDDSD